MRSAAHTMAIVFLGFCFGCQYDSVGPANGDSPTASANTNTQSPGAFHRGTKGGSLPTLSTHPPQTYVALKDTWWENISGRNSALCVSYDSVWAKFEPCIGLSLQRYAGGTVARTYLALDFDTREIPDDAVITKATVRLGI